MNTLKTLAFAAMFTFALVSCDNKKSNAEEAVDSSAITAPVEVTQDETHNASDDASMMQQDSSMMNKADSTKM